VSRISLPSAEYALQQGLSLSRRSGCTLDILAGPWKGIFDGCEAERQQDIARLAGKEILNVATEGVKDVAFVGLPA
jgi:hypothetical protein